VEKERRKKLIKCDGKEIKTEECNTVKTGIGALIFRTGLTVQTSYCGSKYAM